MGYRGHARYCCYPPANGLGPNAQAVQMKATFWIETVTYQINV